MSIGIKFIEAVRNSDLEKLKSEFSDIGEVINFQEPRTGATALHLVAAGKMRQVFNWLVKQPGLDYLIQDNKGRLPSSVAFDVAEFPAMGRYLASKQASQARAQGIDLRRKLAA